MTAAYYNEFDPYAAEWLGNLIAAGHIAPGVVDRRSITEVTADDVRGYTQCHFFAGVGGWSLALRLAGWPDDRPVWTGSCPCQPFSAAGKRKGTADARHLWPEFRRLIAECSPPVVFGEQVASADGRTWLAGVRADLEALAYAVGAADLCAAGVGAPHIRQRLWWVADASGDERRPGRNDPADARRAPEPSGLRAARRLADADEHRAQLLAGDDGGAAGLPPEERPDLGAALSERGGATRRMGDTDDAGPQGRNVVRHGADERAVGPTGWAGDWLPCTDGKARRVEPGTFPLAHGVPNRVGRLRAYGNAIVPQVAAEFVQAYEQCRK